MFEYCGCYSKFVWPNSGPVDLDVTGTRRHEDQGYIVGLDVKPLYHRDVCV
jgi:hypothetical protein